MQALQTRLEEMLLLLLLLLYDRQARPLTLYLLRDLCCRNTYKNLVRQRLLRLST